MSIATKLNQQWHAIADNELDPQVLGQRIPAWQALELCAHDDVVARLLRAAQDGDELSGFVVLYATLPRLKMLARAHNHYYLDDFVADFWLRMMSFPQTRMRKNIVINMALDTLKRLNRSGAKSSRELLVEKVPIRDVHKNSTAEVINLIATGKALGIVSASTAGVLETVYARGYSCSQAARIHNISHDAVRSRCSQAARKLRMHAPQLLAAA